MLTKIMEENKNNKAEKKQRKLDNLIPFKPGQSGNLKGREKGIPNRATIAEYVLSMDITPTDTMLRSLEQMFPKYFNKKTKQWKAEFLIWARQLQKALLQGDVQAFDRLVDAKYGKVKEEMKHEFEGLKDLTDFMRKLLKK